MWLIVLLAVGVPLAGLAVGIAIDLREKRRRGYIPDMNVAHRGVFDRMAEFSIENILVQKKQRAGERRPNYGDKGPRNHE